MDPTDVETVLVAGAGGRTGREVLRLLDGRVPTVRALTHSPEKRERLRAAGADEVVVEDLLSPGDLAADLDGVDVVVSAVGTSPRRVYAGPPYVDGAGNRALLDAAVDAGAEAFAMLSALGVGDDPSSPLGSAFNVVVGPVQRAKGRAEAAIRDAPIRHTILRAGVLTDGRRTDDVAVAEPGAKLWGRVSRRDVARLLASAPVTEAAENRTFEAVGWPKFRGRRAEVDWRVPRRG